MKTKNGKLKRKNDMKKLVYRTIKELPKEERPRERLIKYGPKALSSTELLAIIMRTGTHKENVKDLATRLLKQYNLPGLAHASIIELKKTLGIGDAKACQISACFELGRRLLTYESHPIIRTPKDIETLFMSEMRYLRKENFKGVYLDAKNRMIMEETIFMGTLDVNIVHPREIFKIALSVSAAGVILVHNHPSGDPNPSSDDVELTKRMVNAGKLMGINVLDHIVLGDGNYISLREKELM